MNQKPISVIVVDDHPLFRRGVVELLNESEEMHVIAEYEDAFSLLAEIDSLSPDLLILDLQMPEKSGLDVLKQLRQYNQDLKIIMLTACADQEKIIEALRLGANGYLQKDTHSDEIISQLLSVLKGNVALNKDAINTLANHLRENQVEEIIQSNKLVDNMTERERETLYFIGKGLNNKLIARELGISDGTVKVYVKSLLRKLNFHSRLELAAWTHQNLSEKLLNKES
jgi:two-component system nitrate/nitrite response regulator NarL